LIDRYVSALILEMERARTRPKTVFFGGGTPSLLNLRQWEQIFEAMGRLGLLGATEWTVECNPATVSLDKARLLRSAGVNRISMGVQSLDEALLDRLGRMHSREMAFRSYDILRQAGFENINLDLMFAIPTQTLEAWRETLAEAIAMGSEHLSSYEVIYEEDTQLYAQLQAGEFSVDEDLACEMYEELLSATENAGLVQYEIANFARDHQSEPSLPEGEQSRHVPAKACRHNLNYWSGGSFYGLGPSATSYVDGVRSRNWANTQLYCEQLERGGSATESRETLSPLARAGETAAFGLRVVSGVSFDLFQQTTGWDLRHEWATDMRQLEQMGWGSIRPDRFHLTPRGLRFADAAAEMFLR
jgi:oxygen-independent coproporphyrinogen-3 oxidase